MLLLPYVGSGLTGLVSLLIAPTSWLFQLLRSEAGVVPVVAGVVAGGVLAASRRLGRGERLVAGLIALRLVVDYAGTIRFITLQAWPMLLGSWASLASVALAWVAVAAGALGVMELGRWLVWRERPAPLIWAVVTLPVVLHVLKLTRLVQWGEEDAPFLMVLGMEAFIISWALPAAVIAGIVGAVRHDLKRVQRIVLGGVTIFLFVELVLGLRAVSFLQVSVFSIFSAEENGFGMWSLAYTVPSLAGLLVAFHCVAGVAGRLGRTTTVAS